MENLQKKPAKGILRTTSNSGQPDHSKTSIEPIKWDEMNILQTLHPPGKDYGLMKIEEPKTPFSHYKDTVDGEQISDDEEVASSSATNFDIETISEKIQQGKAKIFLRESSESKEDEDDNDEEDESESEELSEEEKKKRKEFEMKRKIHYNEFQAVKLARKLLEEDDDEEEEDDDIKRKNTELDDDEEGMASDREVEQEYAYSSQ